MMIEPQGEQSFKTIKRVKETRVIDLTQLEYEDLQLFCSALPSRFSEALRQVFKAETHHRADAR